MSRHRSGPSRCSMSAGTACAASSARRPTMGCALCAAEALAGARCASQCARAAPRARAARRRRRASRRAAARRRAGARGHRSREPHRGRRSRAPRTAIDSGAGARSAARGWSASAPRKRARQPGAAGSIMSEDFLAAMAAASRERRRACARALLARRSCASTALPRLPSRRRCSSRPLGFDLIAEVKLRSPAVGTAAAHGGEDIAARACAPMPRPVPRRFRC